MRERSKKVIKVCMVDVLEMIGPRGKLGRTWWGEKKGGGWQRGMVGSSVVRPKKTAGIGNGHAQVRKSGEDDIVVVVAVHRGG